MLFEKLLILIKYLKKKAKFVYLVFFKKEVWAVIISETGQVWMEL